MATSVDDITEAMKDVIDPELGINVIDDSFTSTYNPINISETWHIGKIPSYFSFSKKVMDRTFLEIQILSNNYKNFYGSKKEECLTRKYEA